MSFAYRVSGTFLMDAGRRRLVQTEALLGCTIVRALRSPGGDTPHSPRQGAPPPWTPHLPTLAGLGFARVLGPTRSGVTNVGNSLPFKVLWGDTPHEPRQGGFAPWTPQVLPTLAGLGFARVLGPTRGGVANVATRPLFFYFGGTSPKPLGKGLAPPPPPFPPPLA